MICELKEIIKMINEVIIKQQVLFFVAALVATFYIIFWLWGRDYDKTK